MRFPRTSRHFGFCLLVFGLALLSNYFFTGEWLTRFDEIQNVVWTWRQALATGLLLAAIILAAFCFGRCDDFSAADPNAAGKTGGLEKPRGWLALIPSAGCYAGATLLYLGAGESRTVHWLWLASIVLLLVPFFKNSRFSDFWLFEFWEYGLLALIVTGALTLRFVDLTAVPNHVSNDMAIMGLQSLNMMPAKLDLWIGMAPETDHQLSEHQWLILGMRLFGANHYGLCMLSVIAGTVSVVAVHYLGRILFNRWVGLIAASFLAIDYVHLHFSRIIFGPIPTCFVLLGGVFLMHAIRRGSRLSFALGGVGFGLGLLGYYSGRVGAVIVVMLAMLWFWQRKKYAHISASCWLLVLAGMLVTFGPNLAYGIKHFHEFNGRGNAVILWTPQAWADSMAAYNAKGDAVVLIKEQVKRTLLAPFYFHDSSTICGLPRPMLSSLVAIFFMIGLGYCARRFREIPCAFPLIWIGLTFILGGMLTTNPPFWPHLNIATPAIVLIAAVGAERFVRRMVLEGGRRMAVLVPLSLAVGICFTGINNWEIYYQFQRDFGNGRSFAMRQIQAITASVDYRVFIISRDIRWDHEIHQFFLKNVDGHDLSEEELYRKIPVIDKPTAFVVHQDTDYKKCVDYLTNAFPSAVRRAFNPRGWRFTIIRVFPPGYVEPPDDITPAPLMWDSAGWRYVFATMLGALCLGWVTLQRELRHKRRLHAAGVR